METSMCKTCYETKPVSDFIHGLPTFYICKSCAANKQRKKVNCSICSKPISCGNLSKHMHTHDEYNPMEKKIICECNKSICKYSLYHHLKSKCHLQMMTIR